MQSFMLIKQSNFLNVEFFMLRIKEMLNPGYAKPTAAEKTAKPEQKEVAPKKPEAKASSILAPIKKAAGGLAGKLSALGPKTLTDFQNDVLDALNEIKKDKEAQDVEKTKAAIIIFNIKMNKSTDAEIAEQLNKIMSQLKKEKKNLFFEDLSHYNLFAKHINPVLEKHKSVIEASAAPSMKKA